MPRNNFRTRNISVLAGCSRGSTIVEFGVAFAVLIMLVFFPAINLLGVFSIYMAASTLNETQCHDASLYHYERCLDPQGPILKDLPRYWRSSGLGSYAKSIGRIETFVKYEFAAINKYGIVEQWVDVTTTMTLRPFLSANYLPFEISALTRPFRVRLQSRRLVEDPTNAPPQRGVAR